MNDLAAAASRMPALRRGAVVMLALAWFAGSLWFGAGEHAAPWAARALQRVHVAEHAGVNAVLALWFGLTLRRGRVALITRLALRVHGKLRPAQERYTRRLTAVWACCFAAIGALSLLLYLALPFARWELWADVISPLILCTLFFGEYALRYRLHPEFERARVRDMVKAWRHSAPATDAMAREPRP